MNEIDKNYVLFKVNGLNCALNNIDVQEIIRNSKSITPVKRAPSYVSGVINLRGSIVTILDLGKLFGLPEKDHSKSNTVIIVNFENDIFGFQISEVIDIVSGYSSHIEQSCVLPQDAYKEFVDTTLSIDGILYSRISVEAVICPQAV